MAILNVSNQSQLDAAVVAARGGDTIRLASGTYDRLEMISSKPGHGNIKFAQQVTITSASDGNPAVINQLLLRGAGNVEITGVKFDYNPAKSGSNPFVIESSSKITLDGVAIEGHLSNGLGDGVGLVVKKSQNFELVDSDIYNFRNGLSFNTNTGVTIANNDLRGMSNDSMLLGGLTGAVIEGNDFRDMKSSPSLKHKDMIQFFNGSGVSVSQDIVIRDNVLDNGEVTQAIYFGNAMARAGNLNAYFRDILIEDNYIRSAQLHGITMEHGFDVTIRNNTLVQNPDKGNTDMVNIPLINVTSLSRDVTIQGNKVASVPEEKHGSWNVSGNVTGSKNVTHWYGDYGSGSGQAVLSSVQQETAAAAPGAETVAAAPGAETVAVGGDVGQGEVFFVNGRKVDGETQFVVDAVDFSEGDTIVFNKFASGTFDAEPGGNKLHVWNDGGSVKLRSAVDVAEVAAASPQVTASISEDGDLLTLRVAQEDGVARIMLYGLAEAFSAAEPELF